MSENLTDFTDAMRKAIEEARTAIEYGDVPVGAVVIDPSGQILSSAHNRREEMSDPTAHAEILALSAAARTTGDWRLAGHTLVVTLEPCAMCAGAAVNARVHRIVYGASDPKAGAAWSLFNIPQDARLNHHCDLVAGVLADECAQLLESFFGERRG